MSAVGKVTACAPGPSAAALVGGHAAGGPAFDITDCTHSISFVAAAGFIARPIADSRAVFARQCGVGETGRIGSGNACPNLRLVVMFEAHASLIRWGGGRCA